MTEQRPEGPGEQPRPRKPALGLLSLMLPAGIALLWAVFDRHPEFEDGYTGILIAGFLYVGTFLFCATGLVLGILGFIRRERARVLSLLGILLNLVVAYWVLTGR